MLTALGGSQGGCGGNSQGGWVYPSSMMTGYQNLAGYYGAYLYNDRLDILNAKLIVLDGNNPSWSVLGYPNKGAVGCQASWGEDRRHQPIL
ncbi:MAG: hypothetical protein ACLTSX_13310 [Collinsella sp.]